ncbi:MAG: response regulator [Fimbriimonadaceae bacterium]|jgi:two-component system alkaline phosphatase synthesis response regulator PhoP|nr:response regulator [Chthonomonadaceae bacterium]MCO5295352.1 response regulator [Fimbriimonadaceae bacterium]
MSLKVLVCDDERHIVRLIQVNLERQGYQVVTAFDGKEGLEKIRSEKPNLVVLDVMMPYMDGFEVLKTLRRDPETESLPVIMLTAKAQDKDVFEGYHYGADMYLTKPFNPMELVTFVKRIAQGSGGDDGGPKRYEV